MPETIEAAAVQSAGLAFSMPKPARHHDVLREMERCGVGGHLLYAGVQGFMTSTGRFVGRREAKGIAEEAGQLLEQIDGDGVPFQRASDQLFSEDVW